MTDLIEYAKTNPSLSGIQRVVANLIKGIGHYHNKNSEANITLVIPEYDNMRVFAVNRNLALAMIVALQEGAGDRTRLNKAIDAVYASRKLVEPKGGDVFVIAGALDLSSLRYGAALPRGRGEIRGLYPRPDTNQPS